MASGYGQNGLVRERQARTAGQSVDGITTTSDMGRKHRPDYWLVILCLIMLAIGLIVVYSISPALAEAAHTSQSHYVSKQLIAIGLSIVAFIVTTKTPLGVIRQLYKPLLILAGLATLVALLLPVDPNYPAHRWVRLGSLSFQSVEILKFGILIAAAGFLAERAQSGRIGDLKATIRPLLLAAGALGLIVAGPGKLHAQSDLGSTAVIFVMLGVMAFVAGMPLKKLGVGVAIIATLVVLVVLPSGYRRARVTSFLHPDAGCQQAAGYQACQALIAVGSGGMAGLGLGRSVQAYGYLPEAANDSIFAIYAEKFGFIGVTILLAIMAAFFSRMKSIAERAPNVFSRLIVIGVLSWLSFQAVINIGAMIGLLPLKGITLPFISYGGTSVVFAAAAVGLVFQISYYTALRAPQGSRGTSNGERTKKKDERSSHDDNQNSGGYGRRQRGHITPILAVARELKRLDPAIRIVYISHTGDSLDDVAAADKNIDEMFSVRAGKFRRYNGASWQERLLDFHTMRLNLRDSLQIIIGLWQSYKLLKRLRPGIIFTRGSYVSVPVCIAGALLKIPYVTHDSDAIPSLTNRIIARWATLHAVALPEELYPYPIDKTVTVGVPISQDYALVTDKERHKFKQELKLDGYEWVVLVTGGGLGAQRLNTAVVENAGALLSSFPGLAVVHVTGRANEADVKAAYAAALSPEARRRVMIKGFLTDIYRYSGAANIIIARGGATNLAEWAVQGKACIIVPNPELTGGHQLKNTAALRDKGAIIEMTEDQIQQELRLGSQVSDLISNPAKAAELARNFQLFARPDAAQHLAEIIIEKSRP